MRIPAECPRCREVDERRQSMYEVSSGKAQPRASFGLPARDGRCRCSFGKADPPLRARPHDRRHVAEAVLRAEVGGIVTLRNCFNDELEYDDFVEHHIIRPGVNEPLLMSFVGNTVISGMWRRNEPGPDEDEPESGEGLQTRDQNQKNTTDPTTLTMDRALQLFAGLRSLGLRRK